LLRGKIAVVGATAPSLQDVHSTPTGFMSGPELQANAIWTALHGVPLRSASDTVAVLVILLLAAAAPLARLRARPLLVCAIAVAIGLAYAVAAQLAFDAGVVLPVVAPLMALAVGTAGMVISSQLIEAAERRRLARLLYESQLELIHRLGHAAESRDQHTGEHLQRIARLTMALGLAAGMTRHEAELLRHASLMHDIGKIGIPDSILLKAGPLEPEERALMETHTNIGADVLSGSELALVQMAEAVARSHHERWDGSGYPAGLRGEEIPLAARICSVCDVFDALVTARVYKPAWSVEEAVAELRRLSGKAFDPGLVETFVALIPTLDADLLAPSSEVPSPEPLPAGSS
jgi:HD-GYP domain-containing protein (c-di-GMP phosphodiesterase class II)